MRPMRVVLADSGGAGSRNRLVGFTERAGWELVGEAVRWADVPDLVANRSADVVVIHGDPDFAMGARGFDGAIPTIVVSPDARSAKDYTECGAFAIVPLDAEGDFINAVAAIAVARAHELRDARSQAERLQETLDARKLIERAKGVLMKRLGVSEDAAYRKMQRASQEENRKMRDIADSILSAERLYGEGEASSGDAAGSR